MKWIAVFLLVTVAGVASAKPEFWEAFRAHYKPAQGTDIARWTCTTCHVQDQVPKRNPFGHRVEEVLAPTGLTVAVLRQIEGEDSDGDGIENGEEAARGTLPGDPKSPVDAPAAPSAEVPPLVPTHSLHPLFVHFPLGIFLFGAILDAWGRARRRPGARSAATYAIVAGALTSLIAVVTGIAAMLRMGIALEGAMLNHLLSGAASTVLALVVARWRMKQEPDTTAYWLMLGLAAATMALAGHLGADMVWN